MNWLERMLQNDPDPTETQEWIESIKAVIDADGPERAHQLLERMVELTRRAGAHLPFAPTTEYVNTIPAHLEPKMPGRCRRWNGASARSSAGTRWRWSCAPTASPATSAATSPASHRPPRCTTSASTISGARRARQHPGDLLYVQGHSSPGIYARSFLEGRISESQLDHFRMEVDGRGISSYPHPWLMPDYWQTPTVSMGLGPIAAIYQARNWKYLEGRGLMPKSDRKVWCFLGDGETDEPEIARRDLRSPAAKASTTWSSSSTATCSASTARCAATARSSRNSKARSAAPAGT